jgi:hypothetical protein
MEALFDEIEALYVRAAALKNRAAHLTIRSEECTYRSRHLQRTCIRAIEAAARFLTPVPSPSRSRYE